MKKRTGHSSYIVRPRTAVLTRGYDPALSVGSARPAVFRSSTYVFSSPEAAERSFNIALGKVQPAQDESPDLIYARLNHPNAEIVEDQLIPLEPGAQAAAVFNTGMAAISTLFLAFCPPGSTFVYTEPLYGGTFQLIADILTPLGIKGIPVPAGQTERIADAIARAENLKLVFIESPANPTLTMTDIAGAAKAAAARPGERPLVVVDNTFLGPVFQHPIQHGADLVVYSATKFLAGFSDMLGGAVLGANPDLLTEVRGYRAVLGNILQADECWILGSRIATVALRMNRQGKNAAKIVQELVGHKKIAKLHYPTLFTDPEQKRIRDAQCRYPGSVFSLELEGGKTAAFEFLRRIRIARNAVSLGGMESLSCHPATTTHSEMSPEQRAEAGVTDSLVRISVGVEDWRDLLRDFREVLNVL